jgi:hypothetical protein
MNQFAAIIKISLIFIGLSVSVAAYADGSCDPAPCPPPPNEEEPPPPPPPGPVETLPPIVIIGGPPPGGGGGGGTGGGGPPPEGGGGTVAAEPDPKEKIIKAAKASKNYCKKASEDCANWGARMMAPAGMPMAGGGVGSGFCPNISAILPIVGQAICNQAINFEVALNGCTNVECP